MIFDEAYAMIATGEIMMWQLFYYSTLKLRLDIIYIYCAATSRLYIASTQSVL
jgi:hypothetical protein